MTSSLSWLDFSEEDQRRAREIVQLFSQQESRDELGTGAVRDALSELLFPGTSVLQTRARYLLFVPWLMQIGTQKGKAGRQLVDWLDWRERHLIETIRAGGDSEGLVGRIAGTRVKVLPSTIYWNGLQRFGILRYRGTLDEVAAVTGQRVSIEDALTEGVERSSAIWDHNLPSPPAGFPTLEAIDFAMTASESDWLAERIARSCAGSLLAWLAEQGVRPSPLARGPWDEPAIAEAPAALRRVVRHADLFSLVMNGAALLYNVLLTRRCVEIGVEAAEESGRAFEELLEAWSDTAVLRGPEITAWDLSDFWSMVLAENPRVSPMTMSFVETWIAAVRSGETTAAASDEHLCTLVADRERAQKRSQSRLTNDRLLRQWGGASGIERLTFRWTQVRRLLTDVADGRSNGAGA